MKTALKSAIKRIGSPLIDAAGIYDRRLKSVVDVPGRFLVVMYHRVVDDASLDPFSLGMCVGQQNFVAQARYLKSRFNVLPLADLLQACANGETLPPAAAAITFDDGYLDNLTHAAPVLSELDLPATLFVPTGGLEQGHAFWWDRIIAALADTDLATIDLPELGLTGTLPLGRLNRRASAIKILDALWALPAKSLSAAVDTLVSRLMPGLTYRLATDARAARMTIEQLNQFAALGFTIGGHTVSHFDMRSLDPESVQYELSSSRAELQALFDEPVTTFAYPSGFHNERLHVAVQAAGFECAVSTDRGINGADFNRYAVQRVGMPDTGVADLKRALCGAPA